ncbi:MAG TPA: N-succinylarginine dihydrolase [Casimicrobiaceae bacterium]|jgi:succinylarginine dihydrolase|nr:N-succinylarginine dihydrolase [Casimicrobiaceae bacterium]
MDARRRATEANFDGLPGPTHNYSGLAEGNLASEAHKLRTSNPRQAALQGLAKMKALADRGYAQAVLPPHERPDIAVLRQLGFAGDDRTVLAAAAKTAPQTLAACSSAAAMWVANAATVSPSPDTGDGRVHFTPANLVSHFHRSLETATTTRVLRAIFADQRRFVVHDALPAAMQLGDEGAANHTRFAAEAGAPGVELFVYGRPGLDAGSGGPRRFSARQTLEASEAVARRHGLAAERVVFARQHPDAIDAGAFHNDVVAVGTGTTLFCHERAFVDQPALLATLAERVEADFAALVVPERDVSLERAVATYLFNSQLLARADGGLLLVAPAECREDASVAALLAQLTSSGGPIREFLTFDLRQSMRNGGGPACLRLRVVLGDEERAAIRARVWLDDALHRDLVEWVERHYRDRLAPADLGDPSLLEESRAALDELSRLLRLGSVFPFQRN